MTILDLNLTYSTGCAYTITPQHMTTVTVELMCSVSFCVIPAASDILLRQSCAKILVGDPHQQIYAFRGAKNALQEVTSTHTFYLTQVSC